MGGLLTFGKGGGGQANIYQHLLKLNGLEGGFLEHLNPENPKNILISK